MSRATFLSLMKLPEKWPEVGQKRQKQKNAKQRSVAKQDIAVTLAFCTLDKHDERRKDASWHDKQLL